MSDKENQTTVELPRRERGIENPIEQTKSTFDTLNFKPLDDTQLVQKHKKSSFTVNTSTEQKRNEDTKETELELNIQPLKVQHRQNKEDIPISSKERQEVEALKDELFKLENENKGHQEFVALLGMQIESLRRELNADSRSVQEIEKQIESLSEELNEYEEYDKELTSTLENKNEQGIEFMMNIKKKDEIISDLLNQLSETKFKISEIQTE
ncbi:hypothetical protein G6F57_006232 [Rhizopus arrhizus]|nr:hypothetical protein G6F22_008054 [Rhizopus arrhizus]KAG0853615.1 hypothetical protein G6F17_007074 [Rhizopus arrhizus]KAG0931913.1 hypothetical protein G6F32_011542 [Rhizopus arrhizus]KAG0980601.1 hypothetical protein G6F29_007701 [Rhizopus arrhizus]KAG1185495.1 hypothetical protein G6F36_006902 [Rhizopus arrhizus]